MISHVVTMLQLQITVTVVITLSLIQIIQLVLFKFYLAGDDNGDI